MGSFFAVSVGAGGFRGGGGRGRPERGGDAGGPPGVCRGASGGAPGGRPGDDDPWLTGVAWRRAARLITVEIGTTAGQQFSTRAYEVARVVASLSHVC
jgi:hypothetical protein